MASHNTLPLCYHWRLAGGFDSQTRLTKQPPSGVLAVMMAERTPHGRLILVMKLIGPGHKPPPPTPREPPESLMLPEPTLLEIRTNKYSRSEGKLWLVGSLQHWRITAVCEERDKGKVRSQVCSGADSQLWRPELFTDHIHSITNDTKLGSQSSRKSKIVFCAI